jgi:sorting and assembly machinery component 37
MALPGQFNVAECNNPDISPSGGWVSTFSGDLHPYNLTHATGQLPFLVHEQLTINSLSSIIRYIAGLKKKYPQCDLDTPLTPSEWSQRNAWASHIESHFGNLVVSWQGHLLLACRRC